MIDDKTETMRISGSKPAISIGDSQAEYQLQRTARRDFRDNKRRSYTRDTILRLIQVIKEL